ncbi:hypothetical protein ZIOFF_025778 [Zingiber officinale]|uniref:EF-hand domain-containing protein n=1 Tax=Zingiber officinale TaxID=94328 RepID=A0A8J5H1W5_ZINOF|nr:hypothetical protein ZIOFF_025778 [Zingiber officinale]
MSRGVARIKEHIGNIPGNVSGCRKASQEDKNKCKQTILEERNRKKNKIMEEQSCRAEICIDNCSRKYETHTTEFIFEYVDNGVRLRRAFTVWLCMPKKYEAELRDMISEVDADQNGTIDFLEITDGQDQVACLLSLHLVNTRATLKYLCSDKYMNMSAFLRMIESLVGDLNDKTFLTKTLRGVCAIICASDVYRLKARTKGVNHIVLLSQLAYYKGSGGFQAIMNSKARELADRDEKVVITAGVPYTIIRTGLLQSVPSGDHAFSFSKGDAAKGNLSKEDAAVICVEALESPPEEGLIFQVANGEEKVTDWKVKFAALIEGTGVSQ